MKKIICSTFLTLVLCTAASAQIGPDTDWADFGRYARANSEVQERPLAVLMGDSITDGWDNADPEFFSGNNLVCRGISGQTSSQMLVRFRRDVIDMAPKYVIILAGTNDIARNTGYISLENTLGNLISMCEIARANKIRPILCSVTPSTGFSWRPSVKDAAEQIMRLNRMIAEYAAENRIPYIDYHSALKDSENGLPEKYSHDGVHPNRDCYRIMERLVLEKLK